MGFMVILFLIIVVFAMSFQTLFSRLQASAYPGNGKCAPIVFSFWYGVLIGAFTLIKNGFSFHPSFGTIMYGVVVGVVVLLYNIFLLGATERGSYAITVMFNLFGGITVPIFTSVLLYKDSINIYQILAIVLMLFAFFLANYEKNNQKTKVIFWAFCVLLFFANGFYSAAVDAHRRILPKESAELLVIAYIVLAISSFIYLCVFNKGNIARAVCSLGQNKKSAMYLGIVGVVATIGQNSIIYLLKIADNTSVVLTIVNGGILVVSAALAVLVFKEKLQKNKIFAIIITLISICILSLI